jgi:hypothetical protein
MARNIIIGHGGFNTRSEMILVPPKTTITFLADAGSPLRLPAVAILPADQMPDGGWIEGVHCRFDYEKVANLLERYLEAEKPRKEYDVVYNMELHPLGADSLRVAQEIEARGGWGGNVVSTDSWARLCDGDERTCPTPMLNVADRNHGRLSALPAEKIEELRRWVEDGATGELPDGLADYAAPDLTDAEDLYYRYLLDGVPDEAWEHSCTGIFGKDQLAGQDLVWLSCSGFVVDPDQLTSIGLAGGLPTEVTKDTAGPGLNWLPTDEDLDRIAALNGQKVKDTPNGETVVIRVGGDLVLIGHDHGPNEENYIKAARDFGQGKLTVKKGGAFSKGTIHVDGLRSGQHDLVREAIGRFSDKKVEFT